MSYYFRAVAVDYDGTLTNGARPADEVLAAVEQLRSEGPKVVLCTGRVLADLLNVFPEVYDHFDAIVAENGAAIATARTGERDLAEPVSAQLEQALSRHGIPVKRGRVLLDTFAVYAHIVLEEVEQLGLDCQLIRNRGALMVLPSGVTKGTGLIELLGEPGISRHSTDGGGLARFLRGPVMRGELQVHPRHWRVDIGRFVDGSPVLVPASGINVLVSGETGAGKSYLAGLFAERLITLGYSLCIFDPEGDYGSLGRLSPVLVTGGPAGLPEPRQLVQLLHHRFMSVVIDLSMVSIEQKRAYYRDAAVSCAGCVRKPGCRTGSSSMRRTSSSAARLCRRRKAGCCRGVSVSLRTTRTHSVAKLLAMSIIRSRAATAASGGRAESPPCWRPRESADRSLQHVVSARTCATGTNTCTAGCQSAGASTSGVHAAFRACRLAA